jgi:predicted amidophosphoribosyltransferase
MEFSYPSMMRCPNCKQRVRDYYDIKVCGVCGKRICPQCSVSLQSGIPYCYRCAGTEKTKFERFVKESNKKTNALFRFLYGPVWFPEE